MIHEEEARRALNCLLLEVDASVAEDVKSKVGAWIEEAVAAKRERHLIADLLSFVKEVRDFPEGHLGHSTMDDLIERCERIREKP